MRKWFNVCRSYRLTGGLHGFPPRRPVPSCSFPSFPASNVDRRFPAGPYDQVRQLVMRGVGALAEARLSKALPLLPPEL